VRYLWYDLVPDTNVVNGDNKTAMDNTIAFSVSSTHPYFRPVYLYSGRYSCWSFAQLLLIDHHHTLAITDWGVAFDGPRMGLKRVHTPRHAGSSRQNWARPTDWRSFPVAAPTVRNSLPAHLRSTLISRRQFRDGLKSHLFADAYFWSSENIRYKSVMYLLTYSA